jgi:hypothetical protein
MNGTWHHHQKKNLPLDECSLPRFEAWPASLDLRSCLRASCPALRDSGWNTFSFLAAFCGFFVGAMSMGDFFHARARFPMVGGGGLSRAA